MDAVPKFRGRDKECRSPTLCAPAWWRGAEVLDLEHPADLHWPRFGAKTRRSPMSPGMKHQLN